MPDRFRRRLRAVLGCAAPAAFAMRVKVRSALFGVARKSPARALALSVLGTAVALAQGTDAERLQVPSDVRESMERSGQFSAEEIEAALHQMQQRLADGFAVSELDLSAQSTSIRDVVESVTAAVRCRSGYVRDRRAVASREDVKIVSEELVDCDGNECRAFEATARTSDPAPFDLDPSVSCAM